MTVKERTEKTLEYAKEEVDISALMHFLDEHVRLFLPPSVKPSIVADSGHATPLNYPV